MNVSDLTINPHKFYLITPKNKKVIVIFRLQLVFFYFFNIWKITLDPTTMCGNASTGSYKATGKKTELFEKIRWRTSGCTLAKLVKPEGRCT